MPFRVHRRLLFASCLLASASSSDGIGPILPGEFAAVSGGYLHTCGLLGEGIGLCWGNNGSGELGSGDTSTIETRPAPIEGLFLFTRIDAGGAHTCGLVPSGAAYCWGASNEGGLGSDTTTSSSLPIAVAGGHTFKEISAGESFTCALTTQGAAYCWGANDSGQLGRDTTATRTAVPVTTSIAFTAITTGGLHTCAIAVGGSAYCWGGNQSGQLGAGDRMGHVEPTLVAGGLHFKSIDAGRFHTCASATNGAPPTVGELVSWANSETVRGTISIPLLR